VLSATTCGADAAVNVGIDNDGTLDKNPAAETARRVGSAGSAGISGVVRSITADAQHRDQGPGRLSTRTLVALEIKTGIPVNAWLQSLGLLVPTSVNIEDLTPAERRLLNFARQRGEEWINRTVDWLEATE
jgi:hypothetical protein